MEGREEAEVQISEIDLLGSMFPSEEELVIVDQLALAELRDYAEGRSSSRPSSAPQIVIRQKVEPDSETQVIVTISCTYVSGYPNVLPEITLRCPELNRAQLSQLHRDLICHLAENCRQEVCVLAAAEWIRDHAHLYIAQSAPSSTPQKEPPLSSTAWEVFTRLWIYSHHIYNKSKRKNMLDWARELGLSGFSMPGKPGVVCVEGRQPDCEEFWARVKCLTWKRIMIRHREDIPLKGRGDDQREALSSLCKFAGFEEAIFDPHGSRGNHMDLGQLYQFLSDKGCGDVFQMYFGIEGR
uniref:RWD domain containing 2B n=1 Tax=Paramormyrops kingsleyae TaxID=1676925 RepID=A0A3B3RF55_9TELE|nr:RWD domain-containing protein 2B [Paramormyrops kingsleyae]XP_023681867.1 RWD domain-containing protein 2B [Paramormyrops kingsleyae]